MQSLSATTTAATAVQNPSASELHVIRVKHSKKGPTTEDRSSGNPVHSKHRSCFCCGIIPSQPKKDFPDKDVKWYKCQKKGQFKSSYKSKKVEKDMGKLNDTRKTKPGKVHEMRAQRAVEPWMQQQHAAPYQQTAHYSSSPQSETPEAAFHHIQIPQVNSLNRHIWPLWLTMKPDAEVHQFDCEVDSGS